MPAPIEKVWRAWTDQAERKTWFGYANTIQQATEVRPPYLERSDIDHPAQPGPLKATVTLEVAEGGTLLTHELDGFGTTPIWQAAWSSSRLGTEEMMIDLALYLRTGVGFPRHTHKAFPNPLPHPNDLLGETREVPGGVEVFAVGNGTLSAEAGLQPGDTIVALGETGVFNMRDLRVIYSLHAPGDVVELTWVRGGKLLTGKGRMTNVPVQFRNRI
jgi:hypothetical protein